MGYQKENSKEGEMPQGVKDPRDSKNTEGKKRTTRKEKGSQTGGLRTPRNASDEKREKKPQKKTKRIRGDP